MPRFRGPDQGGHRGCGLFQRLVVGLLFLWVSSPGEAQTPETSLEYQVKAAYLLNFTRYVEWPPHRMPSQGNPITLCILGEDPFGDALDRAIQGRTSQGHPVAVRRVRRVESSDGCHLVFLTDAAWSNRDYLVASLTSRGILTVGDSDRFARSGGVIGFIISNETVRFVINLHARDQSGLRISSRMLSLATTLYSTEGPRF